jgi:hypothetical protein
VHQTPPDDAQRRREGAGLQAAQVRYHSVVGIGPGEWPARRSASNRCGRKGRLSIGLITNIITVIAIVIVAVSRIRSFPAAI